VAEVAPYGSWRSPISAEMCARAGVHLFEPTLDGDVAYWLEARPNEGGRHVLMRADPWSDPVDVTPPGFNIRDKVHEYGGGSYTVHDGVVFFTNFDDQRLYRQEGPGAEPHAIVPEPPTPSAYRYADLRVILDGRSLVCVRERHEGDGVVNELVVLPADGSAEPVTVASGRDFYACPRLSPDGSRLAWLCWDVPNMPWDGNELWVADVREDGTLANATMAAGSEGESLFQPGWSPEGHLHFVSDRTGWWNLYRREAGGDDTDLTPTDAEFGVPMWQFGYATYAFLPDGRITCTYHRDGVHHLAILDPATSELLDLDLPYATFDPYLAAEGSRLVFVAGGPAIPHQVVAVDLVTRSVDVLRESERLSFDAAYISIPEPIAFLTEGGLTAHAYHYPPTNPEFAAPGDERPPLIVMSHGGPTSETVPEFQIGLQFFTSRGFAVVDVNYGGSTGYGREYRQRLNGQWGIVDVQDCINAAKHLVGLGKADPARLLITGGSAGGWTTLCALVFHEVFAAGASYFGVSDLEPFATDTHKFEAKYIDSLVGPWPETADLWRARTPARHADLLSSPMILLQGLEDEVVPPSQAEVMVRALDAKQIPYAYLAFEGEQHGFRRAENIIRSLEAELYFYSRILGFELAEPVEPVEIHHLAGSSG
jgi:dipeptidyl aminopeptidase/acylaminoacyl peptidase